MLATVLRRSHHQVQAHRAWLALFSVQAQRSGSIRITRGFAAHSAGEGVSTRHAGHDTSHSPSKGEKKKRSLKAPKRKASLSRRVVSSSKESSLDLLLLDLAEAIENVDIDEVISVYHALPEKPHGQPLLHREHTWRIAQCCHEAFRRAAKQSAFGDGPERRRDQRDRIISFAEELAKDIKIGQLIPDHRASVHLLATFSQSGVRDLGIRFWTWLQTQDENFVNADVYGSAIELLATEGVPLQELEELYQEALTRFSDNFQSYHLSPQAILADREQPTSIKGISMVLLQGILTARVMLGDTRNAYLALDTALKLYPTQTPSRFFNVLIAERPLVEAFTLYAIASRAGISISATPLMVALRKSVDLKSPTAFMQAIRAALTLSYLQLCAGRPPTNGNVTELVITITQILRVEGASRLSMDDRSQLVEIVLASIRTIMAMFARYGATPKMSAFNSIITNIAGFGQARNVLDTVLNDAQSLGLSMTEVTHRSIISAAGQLDDTALLKRAWADLVHFRGANFLEPDFIDFLVLVPAAKLCNETAWADEVCRSSTSHLPESTRSMILERLHDGREHHEPSLRPTSESPETSQLFRELDKIEADLNVMDERTREAPTHQDLSGSRIPMTLLPIDRNTTLPEHEARALYDELTTEPGKPATNEDSKPAVRSHYSTTSKTGLSLGELRYENWKSINLLLKWANANHRQYARAVDAAISAGKAPPQRSVGFEFEKDMGESYGLSDVVGVEAVPTNDPVDAEPQIMNAEQIDRLRGEILRLRGWQPAERVT